MLLTIISGRNRLEQSIRSSAKGVSFYSIRKVAHTFISSVTHSADSSDKITELFDSSISRAPTRKIFAYVSRFDLDAIIVRTSSSLCQSSKINVLPNQVRARSQKQL